VNYELYNNGQSSIQVDYKDCNTQIIVSFSLESDTIQFVCSCMIPETSIPQESQFLEILSESPCDEEEI
jgi:hypothetical protein